MIRKLILGTTMLALAACGTVNSAADRIGLGVNFENAYEHADTFTERSFVTIRLYEATLDAAIFACDPGVNDQAENTPLEVCERASQAATKLSPAVQTVARSIGVYVYLDQKVDQIRADGEVVPDEVLAAAGDAFFKARSEWAAIEDDLKVYIGD